MIAARGRENMYIEYVCMQALFLGVRNSVKIYILSEKWGK
jgi:hypothetical protein